MSDPDRLASSQPRQAVVYRKYLQLQSIRTDRFPGPSANGLTGSPEGVDREESPIAAFPQRKAALDYTWQPIASGEPVLAGRLVACVGFGVEGAELALATTISGGTFLGIDPSSEHLKAAVRNGSCDFMVNTLDESLRVLKNELRKQKALAVGLLGDASVILPAMVDRGVQPDLVADTASSQSNVSLHRPALLQLIERGAGNVDTSAEKFSPSAGWIEVIWTAANIADWKHMDVLALQQLPLEDTLRRRWLQQASGCFHRQHPLQRVLHLRPDELTLLLSAFQKAMSAGTMQANAVVRWQTADGAQHSIDLQRS